MKVGYRALQKEGRRAEADVELLHRQIAERPRGLEDDFRFPREEFQRRDERFQLIQVDRPGAERELDGSAPEVPEGNPPKNVDVLHGGIEPEICLPGDNAHAVHAHLPLREGKHAAEHPEMKIRVGRGKRTGSNHRTLPVAPYVRGKDEIDFPDGKRVVLHEPAPHLRMMFIGK